jgi:hypothetical protein
MMLSSMVGPFCLSWTSLQQREGGTASNFARSLDGEKDMSELGFGRIWTSPAAAGSNAGLGGGLSWRANTCETSHHHPSFARPLTITHLIFLYIYARARCSVGPRSRLSPANTSATGPGTHISAPRCCP